MPISNSCVDIGTFEKFGCKPKNPSIFKNIGPLGQKSIVIPTIENLDSDTLDIFITIVKDYCSTIKKGIQYDSIMLYSGISGPNMTLDEVGRKNHTCRERVRQVREINISNIRKLLQGKVTNGLKCDMLIAKQIADFRDKFLEYVILTEDKVKEILEKEGIHISEERFPHLLLFFKIYDIESTTTFLIPRKNIYTTRKKPSIKNLYKYYKTIKKYFKNADLVSLDSIKCKVNLPLRYIKALVEIIPNVEKIDTQTYQTKYSKLSAKDVAYKVLESAKKPMDCKDLLSVVNNLRGKNVKTIPISTDPRFKNIGLTGKWVLKDFDTNTDYNYHLIIKVLAHFNKPCSVKKIYRYVHALRPDITLKSIKSLIYRYNNELFLKLSNNKIILKGWKKNYKHLCKKNVFNLGIKKDRTCKFDIALCEVLKGKTLSASEIASLIANKTRYDKRSSSFRIYESEFVSVQKIDNRCLFTLKPDYEKILNKKINSRRESVLTDIKNIFEKDGKKELVRRYLIEQILLRHKVSIPFIYRLFLDDSIFSIRNESKFISYIGLKDSNKNG